MKKIKIILLLCLTTLVISCEKDRYPEIVNGANAQFTRELGVATTAASFNTGTLNKSNPTLQDKFALKIVESGNVTNVKVMVDYRKSTSPGTVTFTKQFQEITAWPVNYQVSLNDLIALFASNGMTLTNVNAGDRFVFRTEFLLKDGTVITTQAALLAALPYAISLTYTIAN